MNPFISCIFLLASLLSAPLQEVKSVSVSSLAQRAESGDAQAQLELALAYDEGKGVPQDAARAVEWFRKAAEQGNARAQNSLGVLYAQGRGVPRDRQEAVRWYKKAAKQGLTEAIYNVAISYYNGEGIEENMPLAYAWMLAAQKRGDPQAAEALEHIRQSLNERLEFGELNLAQLYEKGEEIPQDMPAAANMYLEAAKHERDLWVVEAQDKLCVLYMNGTGVPQDYAQARVWCKQSGSAISHVALGHMVEKGLGGDKNPKEALDYYRKAAADSFGEGYMETARLQAESGSHDGEKKAYFWYTIAAARNVPGANEKLQAAALHLNAKEIKNQQEQANRWLLMPNWMQASEAKRH